MVLQCANQIRSIRRLHGVSVIYCFFDLPRALHHLEAVNRIIKHGLCEPTLPSAVRFRESFECGLAGAGGADVTPSGVNQVAGA